MSDEDLSANEDRPEAWDDEELSSLVGAARASLRARGIEEKPLDWRKIARTERARRWQRRLREGLSELGTRLGDLAGAPEILASAALELVIEAAGAGRISLDPLAELMSPKASLEIAYSSASERSERGLDRSAPENVAVLFSPEIPGALLVVDAGRGVVSLEFLEPPAGALFLLVPEEADQPVRVAEVQQGRTTYEFLGLPASRYLFFFFDRRLK